jgi:hypothetical protein
MMVVRKRLTKDQEGLLKYLLIGTGVFNVADYLLTMLALNMGYREANPIMKLIIDTKFFPIVKILIVPLLLYSIWARRHKVGPRILFYSGLVFGAYLVLMVYFKIQIWMWMLK